MVWTPFRKENISKSVADGERLWFEGNDEIMDGPACSIALGWLNLALSRALLTRTPTLSTKQRRHTADLFFARVF